jgi:NADPH:quinone reductase
MRAVEIHQHGGVDVLAVRQINPPELPGHSSDAPLQLLMQVHYAGLNFVDLYQREGRYPGLKLPLTLGVEAAGIVQAVQPGSSFAPGQAIAAIGTVQGAYAETMLAPESMVVSLPASIDSKLGASSLEHGATAMMLVHDVAKITANDAGSVALVHAASGGVGRWLVRALLDLGVRVLALASTAEKCALLNAMGAQALQLAAGAKLSEVLAEYQGPAPRWVFDSVGAATFADSLRALAPRGHAILYGAASGQVSEVSIAVLMAKSLTVSRPRIPDYLSGAADLARYARQVFELFESAPELASVDSVYELEDVKAAHLRLADRSRIGKVLLKVGSAS